MVPGNERGAGNKLGGGSWTVPPSWKLYFNPCEDVFNLGTCTGWCCSVWKRGHVCVFLWRGAERRPCLYQHPGWSLGCSAWCVIRSWWEPSGFLWRRRNCHCVEARTATSWSAYHMNWSRSDLFTWPSLSLRQWWANSQRISVSDLKSVCVTEELNL